MNFARCLCTLLALSAPTSSAWAFDFEITPFAGYRFGGQFEDPASQDDVDLEEAPSFGVAFDVGYAPGQAIQVFYSRQGSEAQDLAPALDVDVEYFQIGGVATYPGENLLDPYAVGTIGAARFNPSGGLDDETRFAATLGGGVKYFFSENFGLRFEGRGYLTFFDSDASVFCISDQDGATCRLRSKGSIVWQLEAQAGFTFRF